MSLVSLDDVPSVLDLDTKNQFSIQDGISERSPSDFVYDRNTNSWSALNSAQSLEIRTDEKGTAFISPYGYVCFSLSSVGRGDNPVAAEKGAINAEEDLLEIVRPDYSEWYLNGDSYPEQGMTIYSRPDGQSSLMVTFDISGDLLPVQNDGRIIFRDESGEVLEYSGLKAWDAEGRILKSGFVFSGDQICWEIDDTDAVYPVTIDPVFGLIKRFQSTEYINSGDQFGYSISVNGDYAIVGANYNDTAANNAGAAYIFKKDEGGTNNWGLLKKLQSSEYIASNDLFGSSVSVDGNYAVVGATGNTTASSGGAVYIFKQDQGGADNWGLIKKIQSSEYSASSDRFGSSVSVDGDYAIVGAYYNDTAGGTNPGAAYIFKQDQGGADNWGLIKRLNSTEYIAAQDWFGYSVSVNGDYAFVGAPENNSVSWGGAAYIFKKDQGGVDNWGLLKRFQSTEYLGSSDLFGSSVSVNGDYGIVGAYMNDSIVSNSGAAYIFKQDQGGADNWGLLKTLISTEYIAVGDRFGSSVSLSGNYAVVGASFNNSAGSDAGAAYIFKQDQGGADNWGLFRKRHSSEYTAESNYFGNAVFVDGYHIIVGVYLNDTAGGTNPGAAYIFNTTTPAPPLFTSITPDNGSTAGGTAVTIIGAGFIPGGLFNVAIGGLDAAGVYVDATTINAVAPAHAAGTVDVVVTNNDGQTTTGTDAYTYNTPTPTAAPTTAPTTAPTAVPSGGGSNTDTGVGASKDLKAGDSTSFSFKEKGAVDKLSVTVNEDTPSLMVTVKKQSYAPSSVDAPDTDVYEYEEVETYHAEASDISGGTFEFRVSKSWLSAKGYTMGDVVMLHYKDGGWVTLPTEFVREEGGYYYYTAETPSFSWFAIGIGEGETILPEETSEVTPEKTTATVAETTMSVQEAAEPPVKVEETKVNDSNSLYIPIIFVIAIILIIIVVAGLWNRRQKEKYPDWWDKNQR